VIGKLLQNLGEKINRAIFQAPKSIKGAIFGVQKNKWIIRVASLVLLLAILLPYVHAQLSREAFIIRTVNVFPAAVDAEGWNNVETITHQNLDEYALFQDFNAMNAATLNTSQASLFNQEQTYNEINKDENDDSTSSVEEFEQSVSTSSAVDVINFGLPQDILIDEMVDIPETQTTTTPVSEPEGAPESAAVEGNAPSESIDVATTTVLRQVESLFELAVAAVTSVFDATSSAPSEESSVTEENQAPSVTGEPPVESPTANLVEETVVTSSVDTPANADEVIETVPLMTLLLILPKV
jgi:hypothetical protein